MSPSQHELVRRQCRLGLAGVGGLFVLMFIRLSHRAAPSPAGFAFVSDELQLLLGSWLALGVLILVTVLGLRAAREDPRPSWWRTHPALWTAVLLYGVGCGLFLAWCLEVWSEDWALIALLIVCVLGVLALLPERGALPAAAILGAVLLGGAASLARCSFSARGRSKTDEVALCLTIAAFLLPLAYLLLRGLLNVVQSQEDRGADPARPPETIQLPVQVVARDGTYLVSLEAPGLSSPEQVEARVDGQRLVVLVPRPGRHAPGEEVVYSNRLRGRFPVTVDLPQVLQDPPWSIQVEHGLVTVQVAPLGDA